MTLRSNQALFESYKHRAIAANNRILKKIAELDKKPAHEITFQDVTALQFTAINLDTIKDTIEKGHI